MPAKLAYQVMQRDRQLLLAACLRLEAQGWLKHLEEQADSVDPAPVAADIRSTVAEVRAAIAQVGRT